MEKKQTSLQRMFEVLKTIEHEDLNNSQYSTFSVAEDEYVNTALYFGAEEDITLQDNCLYVCIWLDYYTWMIDNYAISGEDNNLPEPDIKLHVNSTDVNCKSEIFVYKFENK